MTKSPNYTFMTIPAKAGIQEGGVWTPAFAGVDWTCSDYS